MVARRAQACDSRAADWGHATVQGDGEVAVPATTPLTIGADASCTDGVGGKVSRLVIDPRAATVTHLVVNDRQFQGRLVPFDLVDVDATGKVRLRCTVAEFERLRPASETVPRQDNNTDTDNSYTPFPQVSKLLLDPPSSPMTLFPPER
jgi:hypothetical protein